MNGTAASSFSPLSQSLDLLHDTYNYNHWIYSLLRPYLGEHVLEVGSGIGNMTQFLLGCEEVVCLEPEEAYAHRLTRLADIHRNVRVVRACVASIPSIDVPEGNFDTVVCVNVLEHIQDDANAVDRMRIVTRKGGGILFYVPACPWAYGAMDKSMGHRRRYSARSLWSLLSNAGLRVVHSRFVNFVGLWGWWWVGRIRKETWIDPRKARMVDHIVPYLSAIERLVRPPVGQSLFVASVRDQ